MVIRFRGLEGLAILVKVCHEPLELSWMRRLRTMIAGCGNNSQAIPDEAMSRVCSGMVYRIQCRFASHLLSDPLISRC